VKKIAVYLGTTVILIMFILFMNSGDYLKQPENSSDNFMLHIKSLEDDIKNEQWESAGDNAEKLTCAWKKVVTWIQFSVEKNEINAIDINLARLNAYVSARDKSNALAELWESLEHWQNINR